MNLFFKSVAYGYFIIWGIQKSSNQHNKNKKKVDWNHFN